jgi:uncharacterized membrane protein
VALALAGIGVAGYLTYVHYAGLNPVCTTGGGCEKVQTSVYSRLAGAPVALIGLLGYLAILASLTAPDTERARVATTALVLVGFTFSAYLTYRELFSIHAICEWCVSSAVILTVMTPLALWRFLGPAAGEDDLALASPHGLAATGLGATATREAASPPMKGASAK